MLAYARGVCKERGTVVMTFDNLDGEKASRGAGQNRFGGCDCLSRRDEEEEHRGLRKGCCNPSREGH